MTKYILTFGQKYHREPHPTLGDMPNLPDGYFTIEAGTERDAREWLINNIHNQYGFIYAESEYPARDLERYHPAGSFGDIREHLEKVKADG